MTWLVAVNSAVVILLALLVVGLLRSHAHVISLLSEAGIEYGDRTDHSIRPADGVQLERQSQDAAPSRIEGRSLDGEPVNAAIRGVPGRTLLAFLSSGCTVCQDFWEAFAQRVALPADTRLQIVVRDPSDESLSELRSLASPAVPVVMSTQCWKSFNVPGSPYFVVVDGPTGVVTGEGSALTWSNVERLLGTADGDSRLAEAASRWFGRRRGSAPIDRDDEARIDAELRAAGIEPGHPSLYQSLGPDPHR